MLLVRGRCRTETGVRDVWPGLRGLTAGALQFLAVTSFVFFPEDLFFGTPALPLNSEAEVGVAATAEEWQLRLVSGLQTKPSMLNRCWGTVPRFRVGEQGEQKLRASLSVSIPLLSLLLLFYMLYICSNLLIWPRAVKAFGRITAHTGTTWQNTESVQPLAVTQCSGSRRTLKVLRRKNV